MVFRAAVSTLIWSCLDGRVLGLLGAAGVALELLEVPRIWWLVILACMGVPVGVLPAAGGPSTLAEAAGRSASGTAATTASSGTKRLMNELRMIRSLR